MLRKMRKRRPEWRIRLGRLPKSMRRQVPWKSSSKEEGPLRFSRKRESSICFRSSTRLSRLSMTNTIWLLEIGLVPAKQSLLPFQLFRGFETKIYSGIERPSFLSCYRRESWPTRSIKRYPASNTPILSSMSYLSTVEPIFTIKSEILSVARISLLQLLVAY